MKYLQAFCGVCLLLCALVWAAPATALSPSQLPDISHDASSWIVDEAEVLSRINENRIGRRLEAIAEGDGVAVKFVTFERLNYGVTVDDFADELFASWYPDPEERAHAVLVVMDTITNNVALRRGEAADLSDVQVESVLDGTIGVPIREGNRYNEAFFETAERLSALLSGAPDPGAPEEKDQINVESTFTKAEDTDTRGSTVWVVVLLVVATVVPMATYFAYVLLQD